MNKMRVDLELELKEAVHVIMARYFDEIEEAAKGAFQVEDLTVKSVTISVSVTLKTPAVDAIESLEDAHQ